MSQIQTSPAKGSQNGRSCESPPALLKASESCCHSRQSRGIWTKKSRTATHPPPSQRGKDIEEREGEGGIFCKNEGLQDWPVHGKKPLKSEEFCSGKPAGLKGQESIMGEGEKRKPFLSHSKKGKSLFICVKTSDPFFKNQKVFFPQTSPSTSYPFIRWGKADHRFHAGAPVGQTIPVFLCHGVSSLEGNN